MRQATSDKVYGFGRRLFRFLLVSKLGLIVVLLTLVVPFSAFEAHVVNVTAKIEREPCREFHLENRWFWHMHSDLWILPQTLGNEEVIFPADAEAILDPHNYTTPLTRLRAELLVLKFNIAHTGAGDAFVPDEAITLGELAAQADGLLMRQPPATNRELTLMRSRVARAYRRGTVSTCNDCPERRRDRGLTRETGGGGDDGDDICRNFLPDGTPLNLGETELDSPAEPVSGAGVGSGDGETAGGSTGTSADGGQVLGESDEASGGADGSTGGIEPSPDGESGEDEARAAASTSTPEAVSGTQAESPADAVAEPAAEEPPAAGDTVPPPPDAAHESGAEASGGEAEVPALESGEPAPPNPPPAEQPAEPPVEPPAGT